MLCQELSVWSCRAEVYFSKHLQILLLPLCKALLVILTAQFFWCLVAALLHPSVRVYQSWVSIRIPPAQTEEPNMLQPLGRHCSGMQGKLLFIPILPNLFH